MISNICMIAFSNILLLVEILMRAGQKLVPVKTDRENLLEDGLVL